jgi:hypothetical protein
VKAKSDEFAVGPEQTMFQVNYVAAVGNPCDVSPGGQRFVFATLPESASAPIVLVTNWAAGLKK